MEIALRSRLKIDLQSHEYSFFRVFFLTSKIILVVGGTLDNVLRVRSWLV